MEDVGYDLQVGLVQLKESNVFLFELILDDLSVEETFKSVKQFEFTDDGIAVIKGLSENGGKSALEFLNALTELEEVVIELVDLDVHNVEADFHELVNSQVEFRLNGLDAGGHLLSFGVTNLDLLQFVELLDGTSQVHDILASLGEGVEADKESVGGDFPLVLALSLVVEVSFLETSTHLDAELEASVSLMRSLSCDAFFDAVAINVGVAVKDNLVADLTDEDDKSGGGVVVRGVSPDHENSVHDRDEKRLGINEFRTGIHELSEEILQGA